MVHEVAASGFGREAGAYERSRPTYPAEAVAWLAAHLGLGPGRVVVDLAAGTGKLTRLLVPSEAALLAVEPVEGMRAAFREVLPGVPLLAGVAEALPLRTSSVDAFTVAQAFHWFDAEAAYAELYRVLRPGGRVGMVWNARDRAVDWVDRVWAVVDGVEGTAPWRSPGATASGPGAGHPGFGPVHPAVFHHEQQLAVDEVVERVRSVSHVASLGPDRQAEVLDEVRTLLATHQDTRGRDVMSLPYRVECYWLERRSGP